MIGKARVTGNVMSAKGAPLNNHNVVAYSFDDGSSDTLYLTGLMAKCILRANLR